MVSGTGKFVVTATVLAPGVDVVPGVLRVARRGEVLAERPVAEDGTVRLVVRDQRPVSGPTGSWCPGPTSPPGSSSSQSVTVG